MKFILLTLPFLPLVYTKSISYKGVTEDDQNVYTFGTPYSYALDRLNQRQLPLDHVYYNGKYTGKGISVYVIDTGMSDNIYYNFTCGYNFIGDPSNCSTTHIHGTHVGSLVGSRAFGTAPGSKIINLRVLNDSGTGSLSTVLKALDYLLEHNVTCSVINLSIGGGLSKIFNMKIQEVIEAGNRVVAAAGNFGTDACSFSPGSSPNAITVGGLDSRDKPLFFSNYGPCVDVYAPGYDIIGAYRGKNTIMLSGTSMSAPLISGIVAIRMEKKGCNARLKRSKIHNRRRYKIGFTGK